MIGFAARTDDPQGLREVLARLQDPVARALAEDPDAPGAFDSRRSPAWTPSRCGSPTASQPTYAVSGDTVVAATDPRAVGRLPHPRRRPPDGHARVPLRNPLHPDRD